MLLHTYYIYAKVLVTSSFLNYKSDLAHNELNHKNIKGIDQTSLHKLIEVYVCVCFLKLKECQRW